LMLGAWLLAGPLAADETTLCNATITTLPYTISAQGHYCFDRNLSTAQSTGNAITIDSDFVVLDLNNFKLGGGSAGLATQARGVYATGRRNITVRNGNIRGFLYGVLIDGTDLTSSGHVIENNVLDGNTLSAVTVAGDGVVVRRNLAANTGGSTASPSNPYALDAFEGFAFVQANVVTGTFTTTAGYATGIYAAEDVVDANTVHMGPAPIATGVYGFASICRDNTVLNASSPAEAFLFCTLIGDNHSNP
jgi:hypothetical protein